MNNELELRYLPIELRMTPAEDDGDDPGVMTGLIPFNSLSEDLGGYRERIMPSAFRSSLASGQEIWAYANHNKQQPLGNLSSGTLQLSEQPDGLGVRIKLPDTSYVRDAMALAKHKAGDNPPVLRGMSFGFKVRDDRYSSEGGQTIRDLHDVHLDHVSPVFDPAYSHSEVNLRELNHVPVEVRQHVEQLTRPRKTPHQVDLLLRLREIELAGTK